MLYCDLSGLLVRVLDLIMKDLGFKPQPHPGDCTLGKGTLHLPAPVHPGVKVVTDTSFRGKPPADWQPVQGS